MNIYEAFKEADEGKSKLTDQLEVLRLNGPSSFKGRHLLNNLCSVERTNFVEIGVWRGSTFVSALYKNEDSVRTALAIDHFEGPKGKIDYFNPYTHDGSLGQLFHYVNDNQIIVDFYEKLVEFVDIKKLKLYKTVVGRVPQIFDTFDTSECILYTAVNERPNLFHYDIVPDENNKGLLFNTLNKISMLSSEFRLVISNWNSKLLQAEFKEAVDTLGYTVSEMNERIETGYAQSGWWEGVMGCKINL